MLLSVIVPIYNESDNISNLIKKLHECLAGHAWEVIFVDDDSADDSAELVRQIAQQDPHVRCIQRIGRRGLSTACIEGMLASSADYVAVIDGDLQHDETLLPQMLAELQQGSLDIVVGSRYVTGGGTGNWSASRVFVSRFATRLSQLVLKADLTDPMSGFFMLSRKTFMNVVHQLSGFGFKILLDIFASSEQPLAFKELAYTFKNRQAGASKLDNQAAWDYGMLLIDKLIGGAIPIRFVTFILVGGLGVCVHLLVLLILFGQMGVHFITAQAIAALVAMTSNFALNNSITYRDKRLKGWRWLSGWLSFVLACSVGAAANVGIASNLFDQHIQWEWAALAGVIVGTVWNYSMTLFFTWGRKPSHKKQQKLGLRTRLRSLFSR